MAGAGKRLGAPLLATVAVLTACTDTIPATTGPSDPRPTATPPDDTLQPTPTLGPHGAGDFIPAEIAPRVATAGQDIVVTPSAAVEPTCGVTMAFYDHLERQGLTGADTPMLGNGITHMDQPHDW